MPFGLFYYCSIPSGAETGALDFAQRRVFGGNGFFFMFPPNEKVKWGGASPHPLERLVRRF